jgi:hypothetical protein
MSAEPTGPAVTDLSQPLYGASIGQAFVRFWKKYAVFSGRASRSEYWWWYFIAAVVNGILNTLGRVEGATGDVFSVISSLFGLAILVPTFALLWRRLHDTNRSGLWAFAPIALIAIGIVLLVIGGVIALAHTAAAAAVAVVLFIIGGVALLASAVVILILAALPTDPAGVRFDRP